MKQHNDGLRVIRAWLLAVTLMAGLVSLGGCNTVSWREPVRLLDGRVIEVKQQNRVEKAVWFLGHNGRSGPLAREFWLTVKLPETGNESVTWHQHLEPMVLNVFQGKVYIVGTPPTEREFLMYQKPRPPYIGYVLEGGIFHRMPFEQIPVEIYDANLALDGHRYTSFGRITLEEKDRKLKGPDMPRIFRRIDPKYRSRSDSGP